MWFIYIKYFLPFSCIHNTQSDGIVEIRCFFFAPLLGHRFGKFCRKTTIKATRNNHFSFGWFFLVDTLHRHNTRHSAPALTMRVECVPVCSHRCTSPRMQLCNQTTQTRPDTHSSHTRSFSLSLPLYCCDVIQFLHSRIVTPERDEGPPNPMKKRKR